MRNLLMVLALGAATTACTTVQEPEQMMMADMCEARAFAVFFDTSASTLNSDTEADLNAISKAYNGCDIYRMEITGYADSVGGSNPNLELSENRAENVFAALLERGVVPERAKIVPMGERTVLDTGEPDAFERRVVVTLLPE